VESNVQQLAESLQKDLDLSLSPACSEAALKEALTAYIDHLISHDFEKLVFYLYRIDVNEKKMRQLLDRQQGENAAALIAGLVIERQLQKIESRKKFRSDEPDSQEEKW
jgi:hypothetical protein